MAFSGFIAMVVGNFRRLAPVLAWSPPLAVRLHLRQRALTLLWEKRGTHCILTPTTNCLSCSLMSLKSVEKETGKGRAVRGKERKTSGAE